MEFKRLMIKVCGMRETENIENVAAYHPNYMGFVFYERSSRFAGYVNPQSVRDLPVDVTPVAVFKDAKIDYIRDVCAVYDISVVQLHGNESPEYCKELSEDVKIIKNMSLTKPEDLEKLKDYKDVVSMFLFDTKVGQKNGGTGRKWDWSLLDGYNYDVNFLLSGGIALDDVELIEQMHKKHKMLAGVDINSRFEISPGIKNVSAVGQFIKDIRSL